MRVGYKYASNKDMFDFYSFFLYLEGLNSTYPLVASKASTSWKMKSSRGILAKSRAQYWNIEIDQPHGAKYLKYLRYTQVNVLISSNSLKNLSLQQHQTINQDCWNRTRPAGLEKEVELADLRTNTGQLNQIFPFLIFLFFMNFLNILSYQTSQTGNHGLTGPTTTLVTKTLP